MMNKITYIPSRDELVLEFRPLKGKPTWQLERFKVWWDDDGYIYGIDIMPFTKELEEFKKNLNTIRLGGIWKGIKITEEDIKETRADLLKKLEERW
ncbi:hypothetical protein LM599_04315 [Candidatus Acetothermia bacterium]|jgi:hypothetical protein|nr:hypothetical protein [Candidatus Acetothermia bacterium]